MGLFSGIKAMRNWAKIKDGGKEKMSIADITTFIINLHDAERNLSDQQFKAAYALYKALRKCHTKMEMDLNGYYEQAAIIIGIFNQVAPYEKYSGMEKTEAIFFIDGIKPLLEELKPRSVSLLNSIRSSNPELNKYFPKEEQDIEEYLLELANKHRCKEMNEDIAEIMEKAPIGTTRDHAAMFEGILITYAFSGKRKALDVADKLFRKWIDNDKGIPMAQFQISYFCGILNVNKVLTDEEMNHFIKVYMDIFKSKLVAYANANKSPSD